jgi:flagella basal body P-ring formation protein FlgA
VLVAKGSTVTMTLEKPRMSLSVRGRALQDGARGDVVRVMNTNSNRIVEAVVVEPGLVVVAAGGPAVSK